MVKRNADSVAGLEGATGKLLSNAVREVGRK